MQRYLSLIAFAAIVFAMATTGALFRPGAWYQSLAKPSWTPPNWLFGPVWMLLYIMIAIAGWRVWLAGGMSAAIVVWGINIIANGLWSYLMFGINRIDLAFYDIVVLWLTIAAFIVLAWPLDRTAALLFVPYLIWVSYASALNLTIWRINP
ncbi:MAG TPA: tryptophan-rich sensory protein [Hyphomicrobiaceae bacterium]|nr:tryptophan-rich sensory protein [Hyphomicrobiaceae bacterium]